MVSDKGQVMKIQINLMYDPIQRYKSTMINFVSPFSQFPT